MLFAPELLLLLGCLVLFGICLGKDNGELAKNVTLGLAIASTITCLVVLRQTGSMFFDAYRIDLFSQAFKLAICIGFTAVLLFSGNVKGIARRLRPEYYMFMTLSTLGLIMMVSSVELHTLFVALELSSYCLYLMVPMRDDEGGVRFQMEAAIKYILFGVVATGTMLYGMSFIYGLTGTTYFSVLIPLQCWLLLSLCLAFFTNWLFFPSTFGYQTSIREQAMPQPPLSPLCQSSVL